MDVPHPPPLPPADRPWRSFLSRHDGHPALSHDPLYSLCDELIDLLRRTPGRLFSEGDVEFERDLIWHCGSGLFCGRGFTYPLDNEPHVPEGSPEEEALIEDVQRMFEEDQQCSDGRRAAAHHREVVASHSFADTKRAYVAWLVKNHQFQTERIELQKTFGEVIIGRGSFPGHSHTYFGESHPGRPFGEQRYIHFYRRWNLDCFRTWDLPLPLDAQLSGLTTHETFTLSSAGVNLFVPWYLCCRGAHIDLRAVVDRLKERDDRDHLSDWFRPTRRVTGGEPDERHGLVRLARQFWLFRYWHLALRQRYAHQLRGKLEKLDAIFAELLHTDEGSIRKARNDLSRHLPSTG
jgi:hypothetical protein